MSASLFPIYSGTMIITTDHENSNTSLAARVAYHCASTSPKLRSPRPRRAVQHFPFLGEPKENYFGMKQQVSKLLRPQSFSVGLESISPRQEHQELQQRAQDHKDVPCDIFLRPENPNPFVSHVEMETS